ncbi:MAG: type IV pilus assembly protein FimV [Gammaproteobacteria bacterium]
MPQFSLNLFVDVENEPLPNAFWDNEPLLFTDESHPADAILNTLTSKVARRPKDLLAHLRRIYFCYQNALSEQLYAALLDFMIVLNGRGRRLSVRLLTGSKSQLNEEQMSAFKQALKDPCRVPGNRFSLFTNGTVGGDRLIEMAQKANDQHDILTLANDYIEYSQLEEAMTLLEDGLELNPEREDLQLVLLELYRSTQNAERFKLHYGAIRAAGAPLVEGWQSLADFFSGKTL